MDIRSILLGYDNFKEKRLKDRFFKHQEVVALLSDLPSQFEIRALGKSFLGKSINLVKWGNGKTKVFLWSQMHGDEATGTMALFDLFQFLQGDDPAVKLLRENCSLYMIPMVNPDGAAAFTRRSAQQIDINRDYLQLLTPEAKILKQCRDEIQPDFGFNLHDQITLWSVSGSLQPATLSFLAPSPDAASTITPARERAMLVIAEMFGEVNPTIPGQIGMFKDEYEPRAFGDNFQAAGTSTILIEAGGYASDYEKQEIRQFYFHAMLAGLLSIAEKSYTKFTLKDYDNVPKNNKEIFHILVHDVVLNGITVSIGINYDEYPDPDGNGTYKTYVVQDLGDLSFCDAYHHYSASNAKINGEIALFKCADFELIADGSAILSFKDGRLL
ncbi:MAG: M14 family zinc carboxypeptidase [Pedobacter sp.]|nr:M14 family zinc carboxypeptidase [Pedobacter sp.]